MNDSLNIPDLPNLIHYAIPFFALTLIIEIIITSKKHMSSYTFKDAAASITMGLGNVFIGLVAKVMVLGILTLIYVNLRFFTIPFVFNRF